MLEKADDDLIQGCIGGSADEDVRPGALALPHLLYLRQIQQAKCVRHASHLPRLHLTPDVTL